MKKKLKLVENQTIKEADITFTNPNAAKKTTRVLHLKRAITKALEAIEKLKQEGNTAKVTELETYVDQLQKWIDLDQTPDADPNKKAPIDEVIKVLKRVKGEQHQADVKRALSDILNHTTSIQEALIPIPKDKILSDLTDDEFNDLLNNFLDEIDSIISLPFVDQDDRDIRIKQIKADNNNKITRRDLNIEDTGNLWKEKEAQTLKARDKEKEKYKHFKSIKQFEINFYDAIKDQVDKHEVEEDSWLKINPYYEPEDIIVPGADTTTEWEEDSKPSIDLFFDRSRSWCDDEEAIRIGERAVKTIQEFEDNDEIILNVYYFSNIVTNDKNDSRLNSGTAAWPDIIRTIKNNKAKNVVLMTDDDMMYQAFYSAPCVVEGCVWIIWRQRAAPIIAERLIGKQGIYQYELPSTSSQGIEINNV